MSLGCDNKSEELQETPHEKNILPAKTLGEST
jgi:hypothetical protein